MSGDKESSRPSGAKAADRGFSIGDETSFADKLWKGGPVTLGAGITGAVLLYGLAGMAKSQPKASARNMGYRVIAQGLTITAMLGYIAYQDWVKESDKK